MATRGSLIFISVKAARSSSDGHDDQRSSSHLGDTWNALDGPIFIERAAEEHRGDHEVITIRRPGCARSFSHLVDASGQLDLHRTDIDRRTRIRGPRSRRTILIGRSRCVVALAHREGFWSARFPSDGRRKRGTWHHHNQAAKIGRQRKIATHDRSSIGPRSPHDRGSIAAQS